MAARVLASSLVALRKSHQFRIFFSHPFTSPSFFSSNLLLTITSSLDNVLCKAFGKQPAGGLLYVVERFTFKGRLSIHSTSSLNAADEVVAPVNNSEGVASADGGDNAKVKRKKLKGKRAVVRWLKFFRYKKKKQYERMTAEEKILYKLRKAHKKEERLVEALKKIEPKESSETTHDPEILTPEEHFFYLKMGLKHKNYVPIGRRGIYQGVILNMHLHWKKHQTVKVIVKTFSPEEVKEIAAELARLTGGIVLDIHEEDTIIMYRGKNYSQPPTEIMSPRVTLSRKKALDKSKYRDGLRAVRRYIPKLEQDLQLLQTQTKSKPDSEAEAVVYRQTASPDNMQKDSISQLESTNVSSKLKEILDASKALPESDSDTDLDMASESEDLSDIFETDIETEGEEKAPLRLYLDAFEKFPAQSDTESDEPETQLHKISVDSEKAQTSENHAESPDFDEVDRLFLRAASLLKKKKR